MYTFLFDLFNALTFLTNVGRRRYTRIIEVTAFIGRFNKECDAVICNNTTKMVKTDEDKEKMFVVVRNCFELI